MKAELTICLLDVNDVVTTSGDPEPCTCDGFDCPWDGGF